MPKPKLKKFLKISGIIVALLFVALAGAALYVWRGVMDVPAFYRVQPLAGEERLRALESVERKVLNLQSRLDLAYARGQKAGPGDAAEADPDGGEASAERIAVGFTGPELDTYFRKWLQEAGYESRIRRYMTDPRIGIEGGHVILAGRMQEFGTVVSMRFLPVVDEDGAVHLRLAGVFAGRLRLPEMALEKFRQNTVEALGERLPQLRSEAEISPEGFVNEAAILASSQSQLLELFDGKELEDLVAFIPLPGRGFVPARVSELAVEDEELVLGVQLLTPPQRQHLLEEIRSGKR